MISDEVTVLQVYQVACKICGYDALDGETYEFYSDAEAARQDHIQEHREQ